MKPIQFVLSNKTLQPSGQEYSGNVVAVEPLSVWTDGEQCVSCWKMSPRERLSALLFGRVWLAVLGGSTQHPVYLQASREYLQSNNVRALDGFPGCLILLLLSPLEFLWGLLTAVRVSSHINMRNGGDDYGNHHL